MTSDGGLFREAFEKRISLSALRRILKRCGPGKRCKPIVSGAELIGALVFHVMEGAGTLSAHVRQLTGKKVSDSDLSQRRQRLPLQVFETILEHALKPLAQADKHPQAFYKGLRLCGIDGTCFPVSNTPQVLGQLNKAASRRFKAAFAQVGVCVMVELGLHNPIAASVGPQGESESKLSKPVLDLLPEGSLLLGDRAYGLPSVIAQLQRLGAKREFLLRVKSNLKSRLLEVYGDGSALVEIEHEGKKMQVRQIEGKVRRPNGAWVKERLWTSLLDWKAYPARELLELYCCRWEQEGAYREMKIDLRWTHLLESHTPLTAAQEIAALVLAQALVAAERMKAAEAGQVEVLRISFAKTLLLVRSLWEFVARMEDLLSEKQIRLLVQRTIKEIGLQAIAKRRPRSCPRAVRQPVRSWPRLIRNTYQNGPTEYEVTPIIS